MFIAQNKEENNFCNSIFKIDHIWTVLTSGYHIKKNSKDNKVL